MEGGAIARVLTLKIILCLPFPAGFYSPAGRIGRKIAFPAGRGAGKGAGPNVPGRGNGVPKAGRAAACRREK